MSAYTSSFRGHPPDIIPGPWTTAARQRALDQAVETHYIDYFGRAMECRNWSPWHGLPLEEMGQLGPRLSAETLHLIEGFLGVEEYVGDYVREGLGMFSHDRTRRNLQLQWGAEEAKHGVAWELVLTHSHGRTAEQVQAYLEKGRAYRWSVRQHPGIDSPLGSTAYAMIQERTTYFIYQELRARIRQEYGLPAHPTSLEHQRGAETGAAEVCRVVARDELAHHSLFLKIILSHLKYFPSRTLEVLTQVMQGFVMPAFRFLPNARTFLRAMRRTGLYSGEIHRQQVHTPILKSLGLEEQEAFDKAVQLSCQLPTDHGPDSVTLSRTGEWLVGYRQPPTAS